MKLEYDREADAVYLYLKYPLKEGECKKTLELNENIIADFDAYGKLIGVEILNARKILDKRVLDEALAVSS